MGSVLSRRGKLEDVVVHRLFQKVNMEIERRELSHDEVARILGIFPVAAKSLLRDQGSWSLEKAVRACEALGLDIEVQ